LARIRTHYDNLKVSRDAPIEVIQAAFRSLASKYHPDLHPGDSESARIMAIINRSYWVISDPEKRAEHDRWIADAERGPSARQNGPIPEFRSIETGTKEWKWKWIIGGAALVLIAAVAIAILSSRSEKKAGDGWSFADDPPKAQPSANAAPAIPPPPGFDFDQPPQPKQAKKNAPRPIRSEIDEVIQSGRYTELPPAEVVGKSDGSGPSHLSVVNQTAYTITVTYDGATERKITVGAGQSFDLDLPPGAYRVFGRTNNPLVLPFFGNQDYALGAGYRSTFYTATTVVP
jgi:hypothetical protein